MKSVVIFVLKALAFTVIFWTVVILVARPLLYNNADDIQNQHEYERQLRESDKYLKRQMELQDRWKKIIERWEKSAPDRKP